MLYLIPYIAEIIVTDKLTDAQKTLQFEAIMQLQGILKHYEKLGYKPDLICKIAEKKGAMILTVTTKTEMSKLLKGNIMSLKKNSFAGQRYL